MNAKQFLSRARSLDSEINLLLEDLAEMRSMAEKTTASLQSVAAGGGNSRRLEDSAMKLIDLQDHINRRIDHLADTKKEIMDVIARLPDARLRMILQARYVKNMDWNEVAELCFVTVSNTMRLHRLALQEVDSILQEMAA